jgi:hypothetical protein
LDDQRIDEIRQELYKFLLLRASPDPLGGVLTSVRGGHKSMPFRRSSGFMPSAPLVADLLSVAIATVPSWAMLLSSVYLMLVCGFESLGFRRLSKS